MYSTTYILKVLAISSLIILFSGCASVHQAYDGPKLSSSKVAVINGQNGFAPGSTTISISSIDGKTFTPHVVSLEVLPGKYVIGVHYYYHLAGGIKADSFIAVKVEGGKVYQLIAERDLEKMTVSFSLVEETNAQEKI